MVSTDALELGIDIGALDAAICVTFPGTVASLRQMWGRAGRRGRGLALYVAGEDALDQFFCRHPDEFLERPVEAAILDPINEQLYAAHLLCAAHEAPLEATDDATSSGRGWREIADVLVGAGELRAAARRHVRARAAPTSSRRRASRCARPRCDAVAIVDADSGELIGTVDAGRGAVDRPPGRDLPARRALVRGRDARPRRAARALVAPFEGDWYTQPKRETDTQIERLLDQPRRRWA